MIHRNGCGTAVKWYVGIYNTQSACLLNNSDYLRAGFIMTSGEPQRNTGDRAIVHGAGNQDTGDQVGGI